LDKLTFMVQQHSEELDRAIKASRTNTIGSTEFTISAANRANKIFAFDGAGELAVTQEIGTYRGNWATSTAFAQRDLVKDTSNDNIYICLTAHTSTGSQPISSNADVAKWALIVDAAAATTSASAAASSASAAATSATNASNSATAAAGSASSASSSASTATTQASNASSSASAAATSATNASNSATAAAASAAAAATKVAKTSDTGSAVIPTGTQAQRDGTPAAGYFRFNSDVTKFEGYNGTSWGSVGGGATGGGSDEVFIENAQTVTTNYTITTNKNAMSTGPITVNSGITVTIPSGSSWVVL